MKKQTVKWSVSNTVFWLCIIDTPIMLVAKYNVSFYFEYFALCPESNQPDPSSLSFWTATNVNVNVHLYKSSQCFLLIQALKEIQKENW